MFLLSRYVKEVTFSIEGIYRVAKDAKGLPTIPKRLYEIVVRR